MKIENGFVKITGSSDLEDSSMAAGICTVFDYPIEFDITKYINLDGMYQRCDNSRYLFSRDQTLCLVAGLYREYYDKLVSLERVNGKDFFSPSNRGHVKRCQGLKANWLEDLWLWADVYFHAKVKPLEEPNQLLCMMMTNPDKKYLKWWTENNQHWKMSIEVYWCGWRNEPELAALMIAKIEERIK